MERGSVINSAPGTKLSISCLFLIFRSAPAQLWARARTRCFFIFNLFLVGFPTSVDKQPTCKNDNNALANVRMSALHYSKYSKYSGFAISSSVRPKFKNKFHKNDAHTLNNWVLCSISGCFSTISLLGSSGALKRGVHLSFPVYRWNFRLAILRRYRRRTKRFLYA